MSEVIALYAASAVEPDWRSAEALIADVDLDMLDRLQSNSWGMIAHLIIEGAAGQGTFLGAPAAQEVLLDDLQALRDALDTPPEALSTITFADGAVVHYFEERELDSRLGDALERLRDFDILRAAGLTAGSW